MKLSECGRPRPQQLQRGLRLRIASTHGVVRRLCARGRAHYYEYCQASGAFLDQFRCSSFALRQLAHFLGPCHSRAAGANCSCSSGGYGSAGTQPERRLERDKRQVGRRQPPDWPIPADIPSNAKNPSLEFPETYLQADCHRRSSGNELIQLPGSPTLLSVATPQRGQPHDSSVQSQAGRRVRPISVGGRPSRPVRRTGARRLPQIGFCVSSGSSTRLILSAFSIPSSPVTQAGAASSICQPSS